MRIKRFRVSNHSRIDDFDLDVRANLVLVGPNDVGKSSILRLLDLTLGASTAALYNRISALDVRDPNATMVVEIDFQDFDDQEQALFPDEIEVRSPTESVLTVRLDVQVDEASTLDIRRTAPFGRTGRQVSREQLAALGWRLVQSNQAGVRDFRKDRNDSLATILAEFDLGNERDKLLSLVKSFHDGLAKSERLGELRSNLADQLSRAIPEKLQKDDLTLASTADIGEPLSEVSLYVSRTDGELRSMEEQSDGTRALFAVALYDFISGSANVVSIDEPEVHLHPTSQRSVARLLMSGNNQKIIATHSSDIVGLFPPEQVVAVRPGGQLVQPQGQFLSDDDKLLVHWWVRDRLEPLTARRIVLVEGVADRIVLGRVAELVGYDLDRLGISVIELDGSGAVASVNKLFGSTGFNVPLTYLIDLDAVDDTAKTLGVEKETLSEHSVFVCNVDLEAEYCSVIDSGQLYAALESRFNDNELANCAASGETGARTSVDLAEFCRGKKRKVRAAIAAAKVLDHDSAARIEPLVNLLKSAAP